MSLQQVGQKINNDDDNDDDDNNDDDDDDDVSYLQGDIALY